MIDFLDVVLFVLRASQVAAIVVMAAVGALIVFGNGKPPDDGG